MFTVLIKDHRPGMHDDEKELLYTADTVTFHPLDGLHLYVDGEDPKRFPRLKEEEGSRQVFVMNKEGSTVAKYIL
jgi:hypothetical protein